MFVHSFRSRLKLPVCFNKRSSQLLQSSSEQSHKEYPTTITTMMTRGSLFIFAWTFVLTIGLKLEGTHAFSGSLHRRGPSVLPSVGTTSTRTMEIFSTPPEREGAGDELTAFADPLSTNEPPVASTTPTEGTSYPIDAPSPILLASSMILAIVGVGSGFDIFSDEPRFPFIINAVISASGLALCLGLFYASILKAQAETEEDDKRYMSGR